MGLFGKLIRTAITAVETPVAVVKDVFTLGGTLTEKDRDCSFTTEKLQELGEDYQDFKDELTKDE